MFLITKEQLVLSENERQDFANISFICKEIIKRTSNVKLHDAAVEILNNIDYIFSVL